MKSPIRIKSFGCTVAREVGRIIERDMAGRREEIQEEPSNFHVDSERKVEIKHYKISGRL